MQERVKTSFIPKGSLEVQRKKSATQSSIGLVNAIASIILIGTILAAAGMFLFERFVERSIDSKTESLDRARAAFEPKTIEELLRLDTRLTLGKELLVNHLAPSYVFDELEAITLKSVRFRDFTFRETTPGAFDVSMAGEARSFNALALQSDAFGKSGVFLEPIFDGLNINETGNVVFAFSASVDTELIRYRARASALPPSPAASEAPDTLGPIDETDTAP